MSVKLLRYVNASVVEILTLDAVLSHQINYIGSVTEHPIEDGSTISDHVKLDPVEISLTGFVTNTPVSLLSGGFLQPYDPTRSRIAYEALVEVWKNKELVQIIDKLDLFENMVMTGLQIPRDGTNFHAFQFTANFKHLAKIGTQSVEILPAAEQIAAPAENTGKQTPTTSTEEEGEEASALYRIKEFGVSLFN
jgi:hypothetical protein